ncbi:MAG: 4-(cytidine 5'-diphospho)-2-C-methyl-D-erythritol kinase [Clostridiales bacterium]|nr:4-(cytidine 5'-diphospho)-2-C-methyl-D-erythritol kinase [Clostridiales bacterium]
MIARAYAKINWYLKILGKMNTGYHDLEMIMQHIDLYDELQINKTTNTDLTLEINSTAKFVADDNNLIIKAAKLMLNAGKTTAGLHIRLTKRIPIGAGLGGGSADAAAMMHALNHLFLLNYPLDKLQSLGIKIGADIPYCLEQRPAIVKGVGESIQPLHFAQEHWIVLLKPEKSLSTKEVFLNYNKKIDTRHYSLQDSIIAIENKDFINLNKYCGNSLEPPAIYLLPEIEKLKRELIDHGALFSQMSGAGSAVFGVFESIDVAKIAWSHLNIKHQTCILTRTLSKATAIL